MDQKRSKRRLLVASIGLAAVSYGCGKQAPPPEPVGNLVAPSATPGPTTSETPPPDDPPEEQVGNLVAPEPDPTPPDGGTQ